MRPAELLPLLQFIGQYKEVHPAASKVGIEAAINAQFQLTKERSVYPLLDGAIRISEANTGSFSNTVLSLATLYVDDPLPSKGLSNKQIAERLGIAEGTVKWHVNVVFERLGVRGRTQAALAALNRGIVELWPA